MVLRPADIEALREIARFEESTPKDNYPEGWNWRQVRIWPATLNRLVVDGCIEVTFSSNSYTGYRLTKKGKLLATQHEAAMQQSELAKEALEIPQDIFAPIEGHSDVKELMLMALKADRPVHILFAGVPASAKTLFLMELARVKGAVYLLGSQSTKAGITDMLFDLRPKLLLVDEIDRIGTKDIAVLLSLAETGIVSETKHLKCREIKLDTRIFAASNTLNMPKELISRFMVLTFMSYTEDEFIKITTNVLVTRERTDRNLAAYIAQKVWLMPHPFADPRQAVRLARLVRTKEEVDRVVRILLERSTVARAN